MPWTSLIRVSSTKGAYTCVKALLPKTPNAFIRVSPNAFIRVSPNALIRVSPNASSESATELASFAFARFARTFFNRPN